MPARLASLSHLQAVEPKPHRPVIAALAGSPSSKPFAEPCAVTLTRPTITSAVATHRGGVRPINEDAVLDAASVGLWAVADGVGGADAGDRASMAVVETLALVPRPERAADLLASVRAVLEDVNRRLIAESRRLGSSRGIASTVVCLMVVENRFFCMWAGDSRLYRWRDRQIEQVSRDHSEVQRLVDSGAISAADAPLHPLAHVITSAVGIEPVLRLDCVEGDVRPGDRFLLCSDGLNRVVTDAEIGLVIGLVNPKEAVNHLIQMALDRGAPDNVSVAAISIAGADPAHG
ncbi:MAG TPA: protein phosphatase 2C domain-containing protein [Stellaceae bacterium]|nr:protein phosphatase 2C domain-containing protein [Stellaceae bacterium]